MSESIHRFNLGSVQDLSAKGALHGKSQPAKAGGFSSGAFPSFARGANEDRRAIAGVSGGRFHEAQCASEDCTRHWSLWKRKPAAYRGVGLTPSVQVSE
jgi:hypothetical protein